jgi:DNA-binding FadR family transcriptional regulator
MPDHWRVFDAIAEGGADAARVAMQELVSLALDDTRHGMQP